MPNLRPMLKKGEETLPARGGHLRGILDPKSLLVLVTENLYKTFVASTETLTTVTTTRNERKISPDHREEYRELHLQRVEPSLKIPFNPRKHRVQSLTSSTQFNRENEQRDSFYRGWNSSRSSLSRQCYQPRSRISSTHRKCPLNAVRRLTVGKGRISLATRSTNG